MDPLSALRDLTIRNELDKISRHNDEFRFSSDYTFPCSIETAYRSKQGNLYTLETLVLFIKNHHIKHAEYIQIARTNRIPTVTFPDRKHLLDYLQGRVKSNDAIEFIVPQNPQFHLEAPFRVNRVDTDRGSDQFVQKVEAFEELDLMGLINGVERPLKNREALLECKNRDFYAVLVAATKREEERLKAESNQRKDGIVAKNRIMGGSEDRSGGDDVMFDSSGSKPKMHLKGSKIGEGVPIILVPSASQTLITMYNVKEFLENGVFMSTDAMAKLMKGPKPECVTVQKKLSRDRVITAYEVRDKPSALKPEDWDRVVAVFVLGKEWQFKDWPFKDHAEIFSKIIGFYVRYEDDSVESAKTVKQWNVKIVTVSKNKRHQDRAAALEVWDRLEEFVRSRSHS